MHDELSVERFDVNAVLLYILRLAFFSPEGGR